MDNTFAPKNIVSEKVGRYKTHSLLKVFFYFSFLAVLGILAFVFKDRILGLYPSKVAIDVESTSTTQINSPFASYINSEENNLSDEELLKEYRLGESERMLIFKSFEDTIINTEYGPYSLAPNFIVFCRKATTRVNGEDTDTSIIWIDYSRASDNLKVDMIKNANEGVPMERRIDLIENYTIGKPIKVGFSPRSNNNHPEASVVTLYFEDPNICYE